MVLKKITNAYSGVLITVVSNDPETRKPDVGVEAVSHMSYFGP